MLAIFRNLVLIFQAWAMTSVRAQTGGLLQPPYEIVTVSRTDNVVGFECREIATQLKLDNWVLYRNCVPENTTDPCISDGNYSDGLLTISSQCDGLYSCGVEYTSISSTSATGLVLTEPISVYAIPTPIETGVQSESVCVGETVFLPSFMPVSSLGNNEVIWFRVQNSGIVPAKNGIVTANYSYNLVNVSTLDAGTYYARVTAPGTTPVNGPTVVLTITEKPGIDLIELVDGLITVTVTPHDAEFKYEWRLNGIISLKNGQNFPLPSTIDEDDQIELMISSPCGASVIATIYILTIPSGDGQTINCSFPTASPELENSSECFEEPLFIVILIFFIVSLISTILLLLCACCCAYERRRKQLQGASDKENGRYTKPFSYQRMIDTDDIQNGSKYVRIATELRQLIMNKIDESGWENDEPYKIFLNDLLLLSLDIQAKKKLPKKLQRVQYVETEGPQDEELYLEMDDLPPPFRAITHFHCKELGISWNGDTNISELPSVLMASPDEKENESDPEAAEKKNKTKN